MFTKLLVGIDGSEAGEHAFRKALDLAALTGASVHLVSVEEHLPAYAATVGEAEDEDRYESDYFVQVQSGARRAAIARGVEVGTAIIRGHAAEGLVTEARRVGADLIVIGHTGHSRLHALFLGSTADRVVEHAPCPVLVVR